MFGSTSLSIQLATPQDRIAFVNCNARTVLVFEVSPDSMKIFMEGRVRLSPSHIIIILNI